MGLLHRVARARLASQVLRRLRRAGATGGRYDARTFSVRFTVDGDDVPHVLPLDALLALRGRARRAQLGRVVSGLVRAPVVPVRWAEARPLLRPVLRVAGPGGEASPPLRRPAFPFLYEFVVLDQPDTMTYVSAEQLGGWGVTADEVFDTARANLTGAVLHGVATEPTVVQFIDDGDAYWTSHLLLEGWLGTLAKQVGGVPVAFAPERGVLLVTADGSAHLPGLFRQAEQVFLASPRAISPTAYVSDEYGCTIPYAAGDGHPLRELVRRAESLLAARSKPDG